MSYIAMATSLLLLLQSPYNVNRPTYNEQTTGGNWTLLSVHDIHATK